MYYYTIYRKLNYLGFSHLIAQPKTYKQDSDTIETFKKTILTPGGNPRKTRAGHTSRNINQYKMQNGYKNKLTYLSAKTDSRTFDSHDHRTQSTYLFGVICLNMEPSLPSFYRSATPKPFRFISTRSTPKSPPAHTQFLSSISPSVTALRNSMIPNNHISFAISSACTRAQFPREHLAVHAAELAL